MKTNLTEAQLRDAQAPKCKTLKQLSKEIESLTKRKHDYGTCVYAMSIAATAAFNHVAHKLGVTGFQASCADLDFLRRTRHIESPFMIVSLDKALYPQYNLENELKQFIGKNHKWLAEQAKKHLESKDLACNEVIEHWKRLAGLTC